MIRNIRVNIQYNNAAWGGEHYSFEPKKTINEYNDHKLITVTKDTFHDDQFYVFFSVDYYSDEDADKIRHFDYCKKTFQIGREITPLELMLGAVKFNNELYHFNVDTLKYNKY